MMKDRKWLYKDELIKIVECAKKRSLLDYALILLSYRHGLRSKECTLLKFSHFDQKNCTLFIPRLKGSLDSNHKVYDKKEIRLLSQLRKQSETDFFFPISTAKIRQICNELVIDSGIYFHHHMLRHTIGYDMAVAKCNPLEIKKFLGHKQIANTMIYFAGANLPIENLHKIYSV